MFNHMTPARFLGFVLGTGLILGSSPAVADGQTSPDNTKVNKADRNSSAPTADQGKNNKSDREMARQIRRDVVRDKKLSTYGHNVKIVATGGRVIVKGPVRSEDERKAILQYAQKYAGDGNVVDQITIASK